MPPPPLATDRKKRAANEKNSPPFCLATIYPDLVRASQFGGSFCNDLGKESFAAALLLDPLSYRPTDHAIFFCSGKKGRRGWRMGKNFCFECCDTTHAPRVSYGRAVHSRCTPGDREREAEMTKVSLSHFPFFCLSPSPLWRTLERRVGRRARTMCFSSSGTNRETEFANYALLRTK